MDTVKLFDVTYRITYVDKPSEVDLQGRQALWGQVDYWTRTIRVLAGERSATDQRQTLWHEILHALCDKLHLQVTAGALVDDEHAIDLLATGVNTILLDNPWLQEPPRD